ncbi:hypothetical protein [Sporosarcina sp. Marseille-Q4943]|nr:hypothetical protein [Sporosarcina sp. Marseille-Q4943]
MKGRTLVIGLVVFVLAVVAIIYFLMIKQFDKDAHVNTNVEIVDLI